MKTASLIIGLILIQSYSSAQSWKAYLDSTHLLTTVDDGVGTICEIAFDVSFETLDSIIKSQHYSNFKVQNSKFISINLERLSTSDTLVVYLWSEVKNTVSEAKNKTKRPLSVKIPHHQKTMLYWSKGGLCLSFIITAANGYGNSLPIKVISGRDISGQKFTYLFE